MAGLRWGSLTIAGPDSTGIAALTLNQPARFNALNPSFFQEIPAAIRALDLDPAVRVIIVNAAGPHFCSGIDLSHFASYIGMPQNRLLFGGLDNCLSPKFERMSRVLTSINFHHFSWMYKFHVGLGKCIYDSLRICTQCVCSVWAVRYSMWLAMSSIRGFQEVMRVRAWVVKKRSFEET